MKRLTNSPAVVSAVTFCNARYKLPAAPLPLPVSSGVGTTFILTLPISVAVTRVLFVESAGQTFAIPMQHVERVMSDLTAETYDYHGQSFINRSLASVLQLPTSGTASHGLICSFGNQRTLLSVDRILGTEEIVVRELGQYLQGHSALSGMTISADGEPVLMLDVYFFIQNEHQLTVSSEIQQDASTALPASQGRNYVLVVDDSLSVRKVAERYLTAAGVDVVTATDGRDALTHIKASQPQIIFTDLEMPTMDGLSLIRRVRTSDAETPIVVVSSRSSDKHRNAAAAAGATDYLAKPFDRDNLLQMIRQYAPVAVQK